MRRIIVLGIVLSGGLLVAPAHADVIFPSGSLSSQFDGAAYDYTITLTNSASSQSGIGTFWFAWLPGEDFLPTSPIDGGFVSPAGWSERVTHGAGEGYAILWTADSTSALAPGGSLDFGFRSIDTPAQLAGSSPFFPTTPTMTSVAYPGAPFSDAGHTFVVSSAVPEPSSFLLAGLGGASAWVASRRKKGRASAASPEIS